MKINTKYSWLAYGLSLILFLAYSEQARAQWTQLGVDIDGEVDNDYSGYAVATSADGLTVAISSPGNAGGGATRGQVRVYKYISGVWTKQGADINGEDDNDQSGYSVSLSADGLIVAIGTINNAGGGVLRGHVRVYKLISGTWTQQGADIDGEDDNDQSGYSVSLSSDGLTVAIGASSNAGGGIARGQVRVYKLVSGTWTQQGVDIDGEDDGDLSGTSVSLSADGLTVAIGAPSNAGGGGGIIRGHVRVYKLVSGTWTQQGADIDGEDDGDESGKSVSLSSDGLTVAIGAWRNAGSGGSERGQVRVYKLVSGTWTQQGADIDGEADNDRSGIAVSLSADGVTTAIGAYNNAGGGTARGHVRVYKLVSGTWTQQGADIDGEADNDQSGFPVSLSSNGLTVAIGAYVNAGGGSFRGHVRVYNHASTEINLQGNAQNIVDGDATPSTTDHTDFGATGISAPFARTFTIQNTGTVTLNIISIGNTNTTDFTVGDLSLPTTVSAGSSVTFTVTLNSATMGVKTATITVNNDDTDEGAYDFAITGRVINATPSGVRGNMMSFAPSQNITVPHQTSLNVSAGDFTLESWVRYTTSGNNTIISKGHGGGITAQESFIFELLGDQIALYLGYTGTGGAWGTGISTLPINTWNHVAVSYVSSTRTVTFYVNGVADGTFTYANDIYLGSTSDVFIGQQGFGCACNHFKGNIEEVKIWNTARTQAQIRENMHLTLRGSESGLIAYYQFNEASGNAIDAIAGNNGTLNGGASRTASSVSVASGISTRLTASAGASIQTFGNATVNFTAMSAPATDDEFVGYQLYERPLNNVSAISTASTYWIVRQFGTQTFTYDQMSFTLPASNTISNDDVAMPANLKLYKRATNSSSTWGTEVGTGTSANNTTKVIIFNVSPAQTSFSEFMPASATSPLPITLLGLKGERVEGLRGEMTEEVKLEWSTASEIHNKGFEVEVSENAQTYKTVAFVEGKGNSTTIQLYHHTAVQLHAAYYRLKQIDIDGTFTYSPVIFIAGLETLQIYPNPNNGTFTLLGIENGATLSLRDMAGKEVWAGKAGKVETHGLPAGIYFLHATTAGKVTITKVVVER